MKLQLKKEEIVPYLPYGLKCKSTTILFGEEDNGIYEMGLISMRGVLKGTGKPILRPLSDLTKEIEVDGEKFVPAIELNWSNITTDILSKSINLTNKFNNLFAFDYKKLLEWHFDVFGLIEKGLAIDINTI